MKMILDLQEDPMAALHLFNQDLPHLSSNSHPHNHNHLNYLYNSNLTTGVIHLEMKEKNMK